MGAHAKFLAVFLVPFLAELAYGQQEKLSAEVAKSHEAELAAVPGLRKRTPDDWPGDHFCFTSIGRTYEPIFSCTFARSAPVVAALGNGSLRLWDLNTGEQTASLPGVASDSAVALSPKADLAALSGIELRIVEVW